MFPTGKTVSDQGFKSSDEFTCGIPVRLTAKEADDSPNLAHLLQHLTQHLTPDGTSVDVQMDLKQAEETHCYEKTAWLQCQILHHEVKEIVLDYGVKSRDTSLGIADSEFCEILEECLNYAEAEDYLDFSPDPSLKLTLLGIKHGDFQSKNPYIKYIPSVQEKLIPELQDRLHKKCENLVGLFHGSTLTDSSGLAMAKSAQLPSLVEKMQRLIEEMTKRLREVKEQREKQFRMYYEKLLESLLLLEKIVNQFRLGKQSHFNTVTTNHLAIRCDALCHKIRHVEQQILCDTYTNQTVPALKKIRKHILDRTMETEIDLNRVEQALMAYESVGCGFDHLAEEYGRLREDLENKKWAIKELAKTDS